MKKLISFIFLAFLSNFYLMAQTKVTINNSIQREKLTTKEVKAFIQKSKGVLDSVFTKKYLNETYVLADKRVIVFFHTHGYLYQSMDDLKTWINFLNSKRGNNNPAHILKGKLLYGSNFLVHVNELVDTIVDIFKLKDQKPSLDQLKKLDKLIEKNAKSLLQNQFFFSGMVAYVGEIFKQELSVANWDLVNLSTDAEIFEPYILSERKRYNPFFLVYTEIYEELPETSKVGIYERVLIELNKKATE